MIKQNWPLLARTSNTCILCTMLIFKCFQESITITFYVLEIDRLMQKAGVWRSFASSFLRNTLCEPCVPTMHNYKYINLRYCWHSATLSVLTKWYYQFKVNQKLKSALLKRCFCKHKRPDLLKLILKHSTEIKTHTLKLIPKHYTEIKTHTCNNF